MLPVYLISGDPMTAYRVGVTACFINGLIEVLGSFCGNFIRRVTPRAALLGTLAGIAIAFIALKPTMQVFARPQIGFLPMAVIFLGFLAKKKMPFNIPAGVIAVVLGSAIAWAGGFMDPKAIGDSLAHFGFYYPKLSVAYLVEGFKDVLPYLAVIIPLSTHNFLSTMQNVESAAAAGDNFDTRSTMLVDGFSTIIGSIFGSVLPTTVYIGHPGYRRVGAHAAYTLWNGIAVSLLCMTGLITFVQAIIPAEAAYVILLYVGLVITAQAFQSTEKRHAPAVAMALIPHIANFAVGQINNVIKAFGNTADADGIAAMVAAGVDYEGLTILAGGAAMSAMLLSAIVAFLIDHDFKKVSITCAISAFLSFFGIIHGSKISFGASPWASIGYISIAVLSIAFYYFDKDKDPPSLTKGANTLD